MRRQPPPAPFPEQTATSDRGADDALTALGDVAIVHDYLNQRGGAEKVVLELSEIWPQAPIYTSLYRPGSTFPGFRDRVIRTTPLDRLPVDAGFRDLFPLYPAAFRSLGEIDADIVIASSSGWAHMARVSRRALHVVYCHTPARWLYGNDYLDAASARQAIVRFAAGVFGYIDRAAAARADLYIAVSQTVRRRIRDAYGIEATIVYPPVDTERLHPCPRGERLLVISRLLPYKRVDLVVRAAARMGIGLDVVGDGPMLGQLREMAGRRAAFHGPVVDSTVVELLEGCRAVCVGGEEDFGIVAVEAHAAGKPVVAYRGGGALETVEEHLTGELFREQTVESLVAAIAATDRLDTAPETIAERATRFGRAAFRRNLVAAIAASREPSR